MLSIFKRLSKGRKIYGASKGTTRLQEIYLEPEESHIWFKSEAERNGTMN